MKEIVKILKTIGLPYAYSHFAQGKSPTPPFMCYLVNRSENFSADGIVYHKKNHVDLELYTDKKSLTLETKIEKVLDDYKIFYNKTEIYIESERLYEVIYQFVLEVDYE